MRPKTLATTTEPAGGLNEADASDSGELPIQPDVVMPGLVELRARVDWPDVLPETVNEVGVAPYEPMARAEVAATRAGTKAGTSQYFLRVVARRADNSDIDAPSSG